MNTKNINSLKKPALSCSEIGLIHSLGKAGIPVIAGSFFKDNPSLYSRYARGRAMFSCYDNDGFIDELCEFGKQQKDKVVLFSDDDRAILMISRNRERLQKYFHFLLPEADMVERILDKGLFGELCKEYDLPAPASMVIGDNRELEQVIHLLVFPVIVKPVYKQDWWHSDFEKIVGPYKKAIQCDTAEELRSLYSRIERISPNLVIQEYIPGEDDQLFSVNMYIDKEGKLKGYFIAQKLRIYPITAGTGCYVLTVSDDYMLSKAKQVADKLKLRGLINIQFKKDSRNGEPVLMEIHARNSFWSYLGTAAGMNLASMYYADLAGEEPAEEPQYNYGVKFFDFGKDFKAYRQYSKVGKLSFYDWLLTYRGKFVFGGYLLKDPLPILMYFWFIVQRRFRNGSENEMVPD